MVAAPERLTSGEALLEVLRAYGVEYVFSSPGSEWPAVWDALVGTAHAAMEMRAARAEQIPLVVMAGEGSGFGEWPGRDPGAQWYRHLADVNGPAELAT